MGKFSRSKGKRFETEIVHRLKDGGLPAERVPLSGGAGGSFTGDVIFRHNGADLKLEAKKRATGFTQIYQWIIGNYGLVIGRDHAEPLIVLRLQDFVRLLK